MSTQIDQLHASLMQQFLEAMESEYEVVEVEAPYNHYGFRGFVDVVLRSRAKDPIPRWRVCELKPELTDLGEAVRQVKKAQRYFCQARGDLLGREEYEIEFPLVLLATYENLHMCIHYFNVLRDIKVEFFSPDREMTRAIANRYEIFAAMEDALARRPQPSRPSRKPLVNVGQKHE